MILLTSPVRTRAHQWPAAVKLGTLCIVTVILFMQDSLAFHLCAAGLTLMLYAAPGPVFFRAGLRGLWRLWPFVIGLLVWQVWQDRAMQGAVIVLRMLTAVGLANLVTMTTTLSDMMALLARLTAPLQRIGLRPRLIELAMALTIRFTPDLVAKGALLSQAWRARSHRKPGWRIVMPMTVLALDEADHVAEALRARGGV